MTRKPPPPLRSPSGRYYNWPAIIALVMERPGEWVLVFSGVSSRAAAAVRLARAAALAPYHGHLDARILNKYRHPGGGKHGDLYVKYTRAKKHTP